MKRFPVLLLVGLIASVSAHAADDTIKIGASLPLTGEVASYGDDLKNGIDLAAIDINAKGGVLGKKLQPLFEDDGADPKTAVAVASRFMSEHVAVVVNGVSRTSLPTAPIYNEENVPFFNLASTDQITSHGWKNIARTIPKNGQEAPKLAALIAKKAAGHKLAMLYASEEYSSNLTENTLSIIAKNGVVPVEATKMSDKDQDFSAVIGRLKNQGIDVVFLGFWPKAAGQFLRQAAAADYHPVFIGDATASLDELPKIAGPAADGLLFTMYPDPALETCSATCYQGSRRPASRQPPLCGLCLSSGPGLCRSCAKSRNHRWRKAYGGAQGWKIRYDSGTGNFQPARRYAGYRFRLLHLQRRQNYSGAISKAALKNGHKKIVPA